MKPRGYMRLTNPDQRAPSDTLRPLYLPVVPAAAGRRLAEVVFEQLSGQCCESTVQGWESWSTVSMRRWLQAACNAEPQVLRQLLQVADNIAVAEVCHRLSKLDIYTELCNAYAS